MRNRIAVLWILACWVGLSAQARSTSPDEMVYNNILRGLTVGNLANGKNTPANAPQTGLRYVCNRNQDNKHDFLVAEFPNSGVTPSVAGLQFMPGIPPFGDKAAGNVFTSTGYGGLEWHFLNGGNLISEYRVSASSEEPSAGFYLGISQFPQNVEPNFCDVDWSGMIGENGAFLMSAHQGNVNQEAGLFDAWQTHKYLYLAIIDNGDTESLQTEIAFAWSNDTWEMRDLLLGISPYVSKTALIDVANRTDVFPHPIALEIFAANPEVLRDPSFITYLETKSDPMPEYMVDILLESSNATTLRTVLMENLDTKRTRHARLTARIMDAIANDSTSTFADRRPWLERMKSLNAEYELAEHELENGQETEAFERLNTLHQRLRLSDHGRADAQQFGEWLNLRADLLQSNLAWGDSMGETRMQVLYDLLQYPEYRAGLLAANVLVTYYELDWFLPAWHDENWEPRKARIKSDVSHANLSISPNPAGTYVNISWKNDQHSSQNQVLYIYDAQGGVSHRVEMDSSTLMITLDVSKWVAGLYFCEIILNGHSLPLRGKFVVAP